MRQDMNLIAKGQQAEMRMHQRQHTKHLSLENDHILRRKSVKKEWECCSINLGISKSHTSGEFQNIWKRPMAEHSLWKPERQVEGKPEAHN